MKRLVVTADDFGLSREVNEAVEQAHRDGILTAASLMVSAPGADDAVARARRTPSLRVGLHLVLVEAWPTLPADALPDLTDGQGLMRRDMERLGLDLALKPAARRQLAAEIRAQFEAYRATGLPLDHVNAHKHFHIHPLIAGMVLRIGRDYGMRALRVPREPRDLLRRAEPGFQPKPALDTAPWAALLAVRARQAGLLVPTRTLGLAWSGAMTPERVAALLRHLPDGLTELYTHPATAGGFPGEAPGYRYAAERDALIAPQAQEAADRSGAERGGFSDFLP
ncbi:hopanoid biosynthesis associated protein HpnK [Methylorubrum populi BJ001]|uniref:Hopanoid biosynthesis associated protein HpnK n=1 Tax=Methylorubrum populi (strain ATCC BAA-705 / NCIMB 13946 / BJ001) TaxID=441620 RepID=B1Z7K1_METPB|nr:hopanoid biosynthesis-associated protein HpnK [Methylorubrum populi]ACB81804.1 hopanoid biosynthesis associated protein HpnK [Methylorubrum populi BJ001]OAH22707.1 PTS cellobiose transporter [Methylorubrum populi]PZP67649.1 MAG: ChbG/HpnK family deacetylase [Methylorubrum populi]